MFSTTKKKALIITAVSVAFGILLLPETETQQSTVYNAANIESKPSIFADDVAFTFYNENGQSSKLEGTQALLYPKTDMLEVRQPTATYTSLEGETFELKSAKGIYNQDSKLLTLTGDVLIEQKHPNEDAWSIYGTEITIDKEQGFISSNQEVTITKDHNTMKSVGMKGNLNQKRIELLSNVRGQYVHNQ